MYVLGTSFVTIIAVYYVNSAVTNTHPDDWHKRDRRSPNCGHSNCDLNIKTTYHQTFNAPVEFNQYVENNCGTSCGNAVETPTTPTRPVLKTKVFPLQYEIGTFGLDFYYLMDASNTFEKDRKILSGLAPDLVRAIKTLAPDAQIGFGLFGDKEGDPENYGLYNKMPLSKDTSNFGSVVNSTVTITANPDWSEDALSGLHQVAACPQINWRNNTLRMILLTTDEKYQKPKKIKPEFDELCHLDANGKFGGPTYAGLDYPEDKHIKNILQRNANRVIFAIKQLKNYTPSVQEVYEELARKIDPKPIILELEKDSQNVIKVVEDAYSHATKAVILETILHGPKSIIDQAKLNIRCDHKPHGRDHEEEFVDLTDRKACIPENGKVAYEIEVTLPCPAELKDMSLVANVQGHSKWITIDLKNVCR